MPGASRDRRARLDGVGGVAAVPERQAEEAREADRPDLRIGGLERAAQTFGANVDAEGRLDRGARLRAVPGLCHESVSARRRSPLRSTAS